MSLKSRTLAFFAAAVLPLGCTTTPHEDTALGYPLTVYDGIEGVWVPDRASDGANRLPWADSIEYLADGPYPVSLDQLTQAPEGPAPGWLMKVSSLGRIENQISKAEADRLRAEAMLLPPSLSIHDGLDGPGAEGPSASVGFDSLDANDCCGGGLNVPPDPELAIGPNHIIAVVNVAFEIYDKSGNVLQGPTTFASFFSGVPGCSAVFDPNVIYDEEQDRFVLGIDDNGADYCVASSTGSSPLGGWNRYRIATDVNGWFFDYPHAGVGQDAIYLGANMFTSSTGPFAEGRVWALDKFAMYAGGVMAVVTRSTGSDGTPQPMNLHGWSQGTWPLGGPHYILTDGPIFDGSNYGVWSWNDPFGANNLSNTGTVNLNAATSVTAGMPVDADQAGSNINLDPGDWRVLDAEYRNGYIWMANTIACNPGGGTVDCLRWAQVDPTGPSVVDAGVFGSSGEYRFHPDLAADDCDNMAIGYTKSSSGSFPSVWVTGREATDTPGTLQAEVLLKPGERDYDSFQSGSFHRWGDYTGMTIDPDGVTFWYLGEYSKDINNFNTTTWGTYIGSFSFDSCDGGPTQAPGLATNPNPGNGEDEVEIDPLLSWSAGARATTHNVYFGTDSTPDAGEFRGSQSGTNFDPGALNYLTTYFWRIDEENVVGTTTGNVWSFTTEDEPGTTPTMHLANLSGSSTQGGNGGKWNAMVQITVEDNDGSPLGGVLAEGNWSNGANGGGTCNTNGSGQCIVQKNSLKRQTDSVTFTLNNLSANGYDYDPDDNEVDNFVVVPQTSFNIFPNAVNDNYASDQDTQLSGVNVMANDTAGDGATTLTGFENPSDQGGTVSLTPQGALTYDPPGGFFGIDTFDYTISDSDGDTDSATVTVQVNQVGGNQQPNAVDDNYSTDEETPLSNVNVLANDNLGDEPTEVTGYDGTGSNGGTVVITAGGTLTFTPAGPGQDTFDYTITDVDGDSDTATVTVNVDPVGGGDYELTAVGYKVKGVHHADLIWSGFSSSNVDIRRNGPVIATTANDGAYTDNTGNKGGGVTYVYRVCEPGSTTECAEDSVSF